MSILITDIEMPENCCQCIYTVWDGRDNVCRFSGISALNIGRQADCPLIEVPPHGRLIEADELEKKFCSHCDDYMSGKDECKEGCFDLKIIKSMPTVIEASEVE